MLEPNRSAILPLQEALAIIELAWRASATFALRPVRTVVKRDVVVAYVLEPVDT